MGERDSHKHNIQRLMVAPAVWALTLSSTLSLTLSLHLRPHAVTTLTSSVPPSDVKHFHLFLHTLMANTVFKYVRWICFARYPADLYGEGPYALLGPKLFHRQVLNFPGAMSE